MIYPKKGFGGEKGMSLFITAAMTQADKGNITEVVKAIEDLGITVVVCAVVVLFLYKILNTMVNQVDTTYQSILPEMQKIGAAISEAKTSIIEAITNHNSASANRLHDAAANTQALEANVAELTKNVSELTAKISSLDTNIDTAQNILIGLQDTIHSLSKDYGTISGKLTNNDKK